ncbi:MAG TPA: hypothetical protein VGC32_00370 [Solirubrobacterales bacterium]
MPRMLGSAHRRPGGCTAGDGAERWRRGGSVEWASRFGSVTMQGWVSVTTEGIDEAGLSARAL